MSSFAPTQHQNCTSRVSSAYECKSKSVCMCICMCMYICMCMCGCVCLPHRSVSDCLRCSVHSSANTVRSFTALSISTARRRSSDCSVSMSLCFSRNTLYAQSTIEPPHCQQSAMQFQFARVMSEAHRMSSPPRLHHTPGLLLPLDGDVLLNARSLRLEPLHLLHCLAATPLYSL